MHFLTKSKLIESFPSILKLYSLRNLHLQWIHIVGHITVERERVEIKIR